MTDRRLPSLTALRAFEAASRHLSFTAAANELSVTPAALSFQIKGLEEELGAPLFVRLARSLRLTASGHALAPYAREAFTALRTGWGEACRLDNVNRLTVTSGPAFVTKWLAPELGRFARAHPEIELRLVATLAKLDFARDGVDLAVRFGPGRDEGLFSEKLADDYVLPVMRPQIATRLAEPADLLAETLITDESILFLDPAPTWARWFSEAGLSAGSQPKGPAFSQADHAVDAAIEGAGVTLARSSMARQALRSGALVAPFELVLATRAHFRIVCPLGQQDRSAAICFRDFLKAEAAKDDGLLDGRRVVMI